MTLRLQAGRSQAQNKPKYPQLLVSDAKGMAIKCPLLSKPILPDGKLAGFCKQATSSSPQLAKAHGPCSSQKAVCFWCHNYQLRLLRVEVWGTYVVSLGLSWHLLSEYLVPHNAQSPYSITKAL